MSSSYPSGVLTFIEPVATRMFGVRDPTNPAFTPFGVTPPCYVSNERPPVNPWRHAYTRRKHFERAARNLGAPSAASGAALCLADLADTLHAAGRLSTRVRDAIVRGAGRLDDMAGGT